MKTRTMVLASFAGIVLGSMIALANASANEANATHAPTALVEPTAVAFIGPLESGEHFDLQGQSTRESASQGNVVAATAITIVGQRPQATRIWVCGEWRASQVGGSYRPCEWVKRGSEPSSF